MKEETDDWQKLNAAMLSLWHLGIIAVHDVGSGRGEGIGACRKIYDEVGGRDSGYLGYCFYRGTDADVAARTRCLELVCGDFLNKNLVTRKIQEVIKASLRAVGLDAVAKRGSSNKIMLRSFRAEGREPPPPPPLHVRPQPPDELVAATTAIPAPSAPRRRSVMALARTPRDPLENLKRLALGLGAPPPIPDVPGPRVSESTDTSGGAPRRKLRLTEAPPGVKRAAGIGMFVGGLTLIAVLWGRPGTWIAGTVVSVIGAVVLVLGCREKPR